MHRSPRPLVDKTSRIIGVLGGRPAGSEYLELTQKAARELEAARAELKFNPKQVNGRRGNFSSATYGISYGGGQQVPGNLFHTLATRAIFERLFALQCFMRIAGFANGKLRSPFTPCTSSPSMLSLTTITPGLKRNFPQACSAFAAATLNFGPATVTYPHIDALNLAWGWCAITALGLFNADTGGHLVLWDLKLIIRFPAGSTILIPSAILRHSNVSIAASETHYSFTQFTAAGLFRWVDNDFKSDLTVDQETRFEFEVQQERARARATRWEDGINSFKRWTGAAA
ncbi:hypothetical protein DFH09DRAFT_938489 [Mycena vulgaris]|nr:hypothetical protein DFH09DRAFT_938489 [Mycena vulgaris]